MSGSSEERGVYVWNEAEVGSTLERNCVYGNNLQTQQQNGRRSCTAHRTWKDAELINCITFDTYRLRQLADRIAVSTSIVTFFALPFPNHLNTEAAVFFPEVFKCVGDILKCFPVAW